MAQTIERLSALKVSRVTKPGMYADGGGLYLQVTSGAAKSWIFRYKMAGKSREMGLGSLSAVSLADARQRAAECRSLRQAGIDPIEDRESERTRKALEAARAVTFAEAVAGYLEAMEPKWHNAKHAAQWKSTLRIYAEPIIGGLPVHEIDTGLILKVLEPIWATKTETASRLRGRIESILDWAKAHKYRDGENPARWKGNLKHLLPAKGQIAPVEHHAALPYAELPKFMGELRRQEGVGALALEFAILTAGRTGEVIGLRWSEIDFAEKVWTVPAARMKAGREHRVPLSARAVQILTELQQSKISDFGFPGRKRSKGLSNMALVAVLRRMKRDEITVHGLRSTFRDWAAEQTNFPRELAEVALAHRVGDDTERAYQRGDLLAKRRQLMTAWESYCAKTRETQTGVVLAMRAGK